MAFKKATKQAAKLRLAYTGPAGVGKTMTALLTAQELHVGGGIAVIDTERGSAAKYADIFSFDVLELEPPYHPDRFIQAIHEAEAAGYDVLVIDSITHEWNGAGGCLELHDQATKRQKTQNSYTAWADVTPLHQRFLDAIMAAKCHVIVTMRSKSDFVQEQRDGRTSIRKVGMATIQRDGTDFEFDFVCDLDTEHNAVFSKVRNCPALDGPVFNRPGKNVGQILRAWCESGEPAPERAVEAAPIRPVIAEAPTLDFDSLKREAVRVLKHRTMDEHLTWIRLTLDNSDLTIGDITPEQFAKLQETLNTATPPISNLADARRRVS